MTEQTKKSYSLELKQGRKQQLALVKRRCEDSLYNTLIYFWDTICKDEYIDNWHIQFLCDILQEAVERVIDKQPKKYDIVINVPPGSSKSTICSIMLPVWGWIKDPALRFITGSYEQQLATDLAVKSRDILKSHDFISVWGDMVTFKKDEDGKTAYSNIKGGSRRIATVGGSISGRHAHIIIIDDAQDPISALSDTKIKTANEWIDGTMSMRKVSKEITLTIYIQQRLAEDDVTGHVLATEADDVLHICIPGEITELDNVNPIELNKYYKKKLLDPVRLSRDVLEKLKIKMGSKGYSNQILQHPAAAEGTIYKREWWNYYENLPTTKILRKIQSWDTAYGKGKASSGAVIAYQYEKGLYLTDIIDKDLEFPQMDQEIRDQYEIDPCHAVLIEDKASGQSELQVLRQQTGIPIVPIKPVSDKETRAHTCTPYVEAGRVYLPKNAPWTLKFIDMMAGFPDIKKKDIADAFSQLVNWLILQRSGVPKAFSRKSEVSLKRFQKARHFTEKFTASDFTFKTTRRRR